MSFSERLRIVFEAVTGQASSAVRGFGSDITDVDRKTDGVTKSHKSRMGSFRDATVAGFGVQQIVQFATQILDVGTKLEAMNAKAETVFGNQIDRVKDWANENAAAMGLTESAAVGAGAGIADLLIPMGFTKKAATDQTLVLLDLSAALSAWSGGQRSAGEVSEILTKAMLGERESLKSLGISITEAEVKAKLLEKGQTKLTGAALAQAKALATQALIMEKSVDAQKAWADGSMDSTKEANEARAAMAEMAETLVRELVPVLQDLLPIITDVVGALADLVGGIQAVVGALDFMGPAIDIQLLKDFKQGLDDAATGAVDLGDGAKEAHIEAKKLAEQETAVALAADAVEAAAGRAEKALKHLKGEVSGEQAWNDLLLNLTGIDEKLADAAEAFEDGELDAIEYALTVKGITLDAKADIADYLVGLGDVPPEVVSEILAKFDPNNIPASVAAMQAALDQHILNIRARPVGDFSGAGPGGTGLDGGSGWDTGARIVIQNATFNSTEKLTPDEVARLFEQWRRVNGGKGPY